MVGVSMSFKDIRWQVCDRSIGLDSSRYVVDVDRYSPM